MREQFDPWDFVNEAYEAVSAMRMRVGSRNAGLKAEALAALDKFRNKECRVEG